MSRSGQRTPLRLMGDDFGHEWEEHVDPSREHAGSHAVPALGDLARLGDVRAELAEIEALSRQADDLSAALRARLAPEDYRLVWSLRDAFERLALAERLLRDRRLADELARRLPSRSPVLRAMRRRLLPDELAVDGAD
jgi:hypothetical protein